MFRATLIASGFVLVSLLGAGCESGPEDLSFKGYLITIPANWTTARDGRGPHQTLVLLSPERSIACRLVVVRDSRRFGETDARAFLATGRDRYGGEEEELVSLETADGTLEGYRRTGADFPDAWGLPMRAGNPILEVYAEGRGTELVGMLIGWRDGDTRAYGRIQTCRAALESVRR